MNTKNRRIEIRVTEKEFRELCEKAKKAGMTVSSFVRKSVADKKIYEAPPVDYAFLLREMRTAANGLNRIADIYRESGIENTTELKEKLEILKTATDEISAAFRPET